MVTDDGVGNAHKGAYAAGDGRMYPAEEPRHDLAI